MRNVRSERFENKTKGRGKQVVGGRLMQRITATGPIYEREEAPRLKTKHNSEQIKKAGEGIK